MADVNANLNGEEFSPEEIEAARLTALALEQLGGDELAAAEAKLAAQDGEDQRQEIAGVQSLQRALLAMRGSEPSPEPSDALRALLDSRLDEAGVKVLAGGPTKPKRYRKASRRIVMTVVGVAASLLLGLVVLPAVRSYRAAALRMKTSSHLSQIGSALQNYHGVFMSSEVRSRESELRQEQITVLDESVSLSATDAQGRMMSRTDKIPGGELKESITSAEVHLPTELGRLSTVEMQAALAQSRNETEVEVAEKAVEVTQDLSAIQDPIKRMERMKALVREERESRLAAVPQSQLRRDKFGWEESQAQVERAKNEKQIAGVPIDVGFEPYYRGRETPGTEQYAPIHENRFLSPREHPLSTFSIDVDTASYANVRRFLNGGRLPPADSVRIEELVNYFRYEYQEPREGKPFSVNMEVAECPWRSGHWLLRVGLKGKEVPRSERPASNLVFLLDVSGSMADENKLPLLKTAMKMLAGELGEDDKVSIVTYAGEAGLKLGPTRGSEQRKISRVIEGLSAGGSTNGSAGIELAYEQAAAGFIEGGTNRVILCTDGDLNVGITSDEALTKLIKQKAKSGVFLTVLGFGEGNLKDGKMERLADNGNGLYAYIDSVREARKVLVEQLTGSTITIAKDVKIQIEFNPAQVAAYRLLGYENRVMAAKDFSNDKKDAGEIGAGHTVTALYELVPVGAEQTDAPAVPGVDPLKYQEPGARSREPGSVGNALRGVPGTRENAANTDASGELLTLKLRYKEPDGDTSELLEYPLKERAVSFRSASEDFQFAASVASFGMVLRGSQYRGDSNLAFVEEIAASSLGRDEGGYRAEFLDLVRKARGLGAR